MFDLGVAMLLVRVSLQFSSRANLAADDDDHHVDDVYVPVDWNTNRS